MTQSPTPSSGQPDIKPRSRDVTDGLEKAGARGMLRAVGMGDDDWRTLYIPATTSVYRVRMKVAGNRLGYMN